MAYLAHLDNPVAPAAGGAPANNGGLTMKGLQTNIVNGVDQILRTAGAPLSYSIIGAANAEIPMTQIATYLAAGYYKKLVSLCATVDDNAVEREAKGLGLTHDNLMRLLMNGMHADFDITIDMKSAEVGKGDDRIWPRAFWYRLKIWKLSMRAYIRRTARA
jgi:Cu/Ag efflux protein CusF